MQDDGGLAVRVSAGLPVESLPVADVEHPVGVRLDVWMQLAHGLVHTVTLGSIHLIVAIA